MRGAILRSMASIFLQRRIRFCNNLLTLSLNFVVPLNISDLFSMLRTLLDLDICFELYSLLVVAIGCLTCDFFLAS